MFKTAISSLLLRLLSRHSGSEPHEFGPPRLGNDASIAALLTVAVAGNHSARGNDREPRLLPERGLECRHRGLVFGRERQRSYRMAMSDLFDLIAVSPD